MQSSVSDCLLKRAQGTLNSMLIKQLKNEGQYFYFIASAFINGLT